MANQTVGIRQFFEMLVESAGVSGRMEEPVRVMRERTGQIGFAVARTLEALAARGCIRNEYGGERGKQILASVMLMREWPEGCEESAAPDPGGAYQPSHQAVPVVVLVDFDNALNVALESDISLSFRRIKEFVRSRYGRIVSAEAFLSPYSTKPGNVALLSAAGYVVAACPREFKDKDAVDTLIQWRARMYLTDLSVEIVVIVSVDRDFADLVQFAADRRKKVVLVDIRNNPKTFEGMDTFPELRNSRRLQRFQRALELFVGSVSNPNDDEAERGSFISEAFRTIVRIQAERGATEEKQGERWSFGTLHEEVWGALAGTWGNAFSPADLEAAMTALVESGALVKNATPHFTYYTVDPNSPLMAKVAP